MTDVRVGFSRSTTHPSGACATRVTPSTTGGGGGCVDMLNHVVLGERFRPAILDDDVKVTIFNEGVLFARWRKKGPASGEGNRTMDICMSRTAAPDLLRVIQPWIPDRLEIFQLFFQVSSLTNDPGFGGALASTPGRRVFLGVEPRRSGRPWGMPADWPQCSAEPKYPSLASSSVSG